MYYNITLKYGMLYVITQGATNLNWPVKETFLLLDTEVNLCTAQYSQTL